MTERIKEHRDFRRLYGRGTSLVAHDVVLYFTPTKRKTIRFGVACSKKVGCAVVRNRAKRVLRAAFMAVVPDIEGNGKSGGYDFILVARSITPKRKSTQVEESIRHQLTRAGVIITADEHEKADN